jgi:hypothetical protein
VEHGFAPDYCRRNRVRVRHVADHDVGYRDAMRLQGRGYPIEGPGEQAHIVSCPHEGGDAMRAHEPGATSNQDEHLLTLILPESPQLGTIHAIRWQGSCQRHVCDPPCAIHRASHFPSGPGFRNVP